jgi:hypothetical protein
VPEYSVNPIPIAWVEWDWYDWSQPSLSVSVESLGRA